MCYNIVRSQRRVENEDRRKTNKKIPLGLLEDISLIDKYLDFFSGPPSGDADLKDYYTKIMQDSGIATFRRTKPLL